MKLELKHLAPYLPYGLKYHSMGEFEKQEYIDIKPKPSEFEMVGLSGLWIYSNCDYASFVEDSFPILRPLSDLTYDDAKDWEYPDEGHLERSLLSGHAPYSVWIEFVKEHYDIFNLIPQNLAIDINTLKTKTK